MILTRQLVGSIYIRRQADRSVRERGDIPKVESRLGGGARSSNDENSASVQGDEQFNPIGKDVWRKGGIMEKAYVSILLVILFSTVVVSLGYAQGNCCNPGSACCGTSNISAGQKQIRATSPAPTQMKLRTGNQSPPQLNPMPWSASINQIGNLQRLPSAASGSQPQSALIQDQSDLTGQKSTPRASAMSEILAFSSIFGTLW